MRTREVNSSSISSSEVTVASLVERARLQRVVSQGGGRTEHHKQAAYQRGQDGTRRDRHRATP
ncbi:hypothetical protein ACFSTC_59555 [Nonomuraea ferruginea]